jgi:hypothetical protein
MSIQKEFENYTEELFPLHLESIENIIALRKNSGNKIPTGKNLNTEIDKKNREWKTVRGIYSKFSIIAKITPKEILKIL